MSDHLRSRPARSVGVALSLAASLVSGCAAPRPAQADDHPREWTFAPKDLIYPVYVADPRRATFGISSVTATDSEIVGAGDDRYNVRMGARFGLLRNGHAENTRGAVQLDVEIGYIGQFDQENSTDNLGWDGLYGLLMSWRASEQLALQLGIKHDSSHLGDEFIESTGRTRVNYTREEITAGVSYDFADAWRTYGEYGWAYNIRNEDVMERGRGQAGLEFGSAPILKNNLMATYGALDVSSFEENDWDANLSAQIGVLWRTEGKGSVWRIGLEYYDGRSPIGEFFQEDERYLGMGLWLDL